MTECVIDSKKLLATTDAMVWAEEFCRAFSLYDEDGVIEDKEGLILGWFANAIEVGREAGRRAEAKCSPEKPCEKPDDLHILIYGECFAKGYDRYVSLGSGVPDGVVLEAEA